MEVRIINLEKKLINLKNIKKTSQYKRRVFNKGNSEIIKEIDNFYSA